MRRFSQFLILIILAACNSNPQLKVDKPEFKAIASVQLDREKLDKYFEKHEIKPVLVINNAEGNQTEIQLSKHIIKWIDTEDESKLKINNDLFSLKDKATLNIVWDDRDSVDFANNWDEIKLYNVNGRELIGVRMSFHPCTGLGCNVEYFLIYDVETKTKNFFGSFHADNILALYNFNNDNKVDYLAKTFQGDAHGSTPNEFIYELYSLNEKGQFVIQKEIK